MSDRHGECQYLDMAKLKETFMDNMDIVKQVLSSFKGSFETFESEFLEAKGASDTAQMARLVHGLKGSAGNIRAGDISAKAADLQHKLDDGQMPIELAEEVISDLTGLLSEIDAVVSGQVQ